MAIKYDKILGEVREQDTGGGGGGGAVDSVNGLTGTVILTTSSISTTLNKRYVTDADLTTLSNTSGTNTGDQDLTDLGITATATELNYTDGVTSAIQTQIDGKASTSHTHTASQVTDFDTEVSNNTDVAANTTARHTHSNTTALNAVSGVNTGDQTLTDLGLTASAIELNYTDGVTSGIQAQIDGKANTSHNHTASQVTDFDTEVSNNTDVAANTSARHTHANSAALSLVSGTNTGDQTNITGNAATATALQTARTINGVSFDGTGNITVADSTKVPTTTTVNTKALSSNIVLNQDEILDGTTYKQYSSTEKTKLAGIATAATANDTDVNLKARANHTGTQTASTISDFTEATQDVIGSSVVSGTNVTVTYDDTAGTTTIDATGGGGDLQYVPPASGMWVNYARPSGLSTFAMVSGRVYYVPVYINTSTAVDRVAIYITSTTAGASSTIEMGLYSNTNALPDSRIDTYGTINSTLTTTQEITISKTLASGIYWVASLAVSTSGAPTVRSSGTVAILAPSATASDALNLVVGGRIQSGQTALPATATPAGTATNLPQLAFRVV